MPRPKKTAAAMLDGGNRSRISKAELAERGRGDVEVGTLPMEPPAWLPDALRGDFARTASTMAAHGVADGMFSDAAARLAVCSRNLALADAMLDRALSDPAAEPAAAAAVYRMQDTAFRQWRNMLNDLGLTPRTCSYLRRGEGDGRPANRFADLVGG